MNKQILNNSGLSIKHHNVYKTKRPTCDYLEDILFYEYPILDHGKLVVVDYMGDEASIAEAARISYGAGTRKASSDAGLIRFMMRHRHNTPIESLEIKFMMKLPIFVMRQHVRHRTSTINEQSARYSILEKEFYLPEPSVIAVQSKSNKQGREANSVPPEYAEKVLNLLKQDALTNYAHYEELLNETAEGGVIDPDGIGLARELARMDLTLNFYTSIIWKLNLHNLLHYLSLRADSHAQYEIRVYAEQMLEIVKLWVPNVYDAFMDYRMNAVTISGTELEYLKHRIKYLEDCSGQHLIVHKPEGISKREFDVLKNVFDTSVVS